MPSDLKHTMIDQANSIYKAKRVMFGIETKLAMLQVQGTAFIGQR